MIKITASQLRSKLFTVLDKVSEGETVSIQNKGKQVAFLIPPRKIDWRSNIKVKAELLTDPESAFAPMNDI